MPEVTEICCDPFRRARGGEAPSPDVCVCVCECRLGEIDGVPVKCVLCSKLSSVSVRHLVRSRPAACLPAQVFYCDLYTEVLHSFDA